MKKQTLKTTLFLSVLIILLSCMVGCDRQKLNGKLMKTEDGNLYKIYSRAGDLYYFEKIDTTEINKIIEFGGDAR